MVVANVQISVVLVAIYGGWSGYNSGWFDFLDFSNDAVIRDGSGQPGKRANRVRLDVNTAANELSKIISIEGQPSCRELFSESHQDELLWGTYRPQLYCGFRTRSGTDSILFGMMWYESSAGPFKIRILQSPSLAQSFSVLPLGSP